MRSTASCCPCPTRGLPTPCRWRSTTPTRRSFSASASPTNARRSRSSGSRTISTRRSTIDNDEAPGSGKEIDPAGPLAFRSTLPVDEIAAALEAEGIPAEVSRDAGGFLCNHVFYVLMQTLDPKRIGGFIHVPPAYVLPPDDLVRAAGVIVAVCGRHISKS
jgi:hypothetical protein